MNRETLVAWGTILLILFIPVAIISSVLWGLLHFIIESLDFLKAYFELIKKLFED